MPKEKPRQFWLPYVIAFVGICASIGLWFIIWSDLHKIFDPNPDLESYHPWIVLILGVCISILVGVIVGVMQLSNLRATKLNKINADLKREITERLQAEEMKQKLELALHQGQKLQAIGTLAGGIAHDFNNLLYAIIGYVEMAREDVAKDTQLYKNLGKVHEAGLRGRELVARILAFSRRQHHHFDTIDLKSTIEAALGLLKPTIPASVSIIFNHPVDVEVKGNQTQLHQVLVNIINNAVDAMDGEGTVTIDMSLVAKDDPFLKQFPETLGQNYCKLVISDTGHGMDQATMERIFEPFFTTKEVGKGTGLGLSIAHSIIKDHQGEITVHSQLGHGTEITILLPVYSAP